MISSLIGKTRDFIFSELMHVERPAVACSFGKDSMVMLALVREVKLNIPVLYFEAFEHPTKHAFVERITKEWRLNLYRPSARVREAIAKDGHIEVVELFELAPQRFMWFPIEAAEDYTPDAGCFCALEKIHQPTTSVAMSFDAVFIGHRGDDVDPNYGAAPLISDVVDPGGFRYLYPLKDWTEADIWEASQRLGIPQNEARYGGDMAANNDYYPLCTECLKVSDGFVNCPLSGGQVPALGGEYLERRREWWHQRFVNLAA